MQLDALATAWCTKVFEDRGSGARADRPGLGKEHEYVRDGDVLIVWKWDRLGHGAS
jgi:DNA invertase Pin-like site-specific DNA recombinase